MSIFSEIKGTKLKRTGFDLSFNNKLTCEMGKLYPILIQDILPGDTFKVNSTLFMRMAPMIAPMMSRVKVYTHYFFVPKRLVWDKWTEFITGQPQDEARINAVESEMSGEYLPPEYPYFRLAELNDGVHCNLSEDFQDGSLFDYLGFPTFRKEDPRYKEDGLSQMLIIDALPIRAYNLIWNEFYRDQNLDKPVYLSIDKSGDQDEVIPLNSKRYLFSLKNRCWRKDYFTSALPFAQAGPDVELPMSGDASLYTKESNREGFLRLKPLPQNLWKGVRQKVFKGGDGWNLMNFSNQGDNLRGKDNSTFVEGQASDGTRMDVAIDLPQDSNNSYLHGINTKDLERYIGVDLSNVNSATINELRRAFAAQRFLEAEARGGSRYIEELLNIFGVRSSDARLQRPEYLGGSSQPIVISDVLQTSSTDSESPQGNQAGTGASIGGTHGFTRHFEEHGYVIGIMSIVPEASYMQGLPKMFTKFDRLDHYWPQFAHLGEQEIKNSELYYDGQIFYIPQGHSESDVPDDRKDKVFGYTPRYAEYKYNQNQIHGDFRNNLMFWHLGRSFDQQPVLNSSFVHANPSNRIFAVEDGKYHHFWFNIQHDIKAIRSMPRFGTPI